MFSVCPFMFVIIDLKKRNLTRNNEKHTPAVSRGIVCFWGLAHVSLVTAFTVTIHQTCRPAGEQKFDKGNKTNASAPFL